MVKIVREEYFISAPPGDLTIEEVHGEDTSQGVIVHVPGLPGERSPALLPLHQLMADQGYRIVFYNHPGMWDQVGYLSVTGSVDAFSEVINFVTSTWSAPFIFAEGYGSAISLLAIVTHCLEVRAILNWAPLPGFDIYDPVKYPNRSRQLLAEMTMLSKSGIIHTNAQSTYPPTPNLEEVLRQLHSRRIPLLTMVGRNDEGLKFVRSRFSVGVLEVHDFIPPNCVSSQLQEDIVSRITRFFGSVRRF